MSNELARNASLFKRHSTISFVEPMDEDIILPCFRCGKPSTHGTWIITGTKEGEPQNMRFESVCKKCYAILREKERTRSRMVDDPQ